METYRNITTTAEYAPGKFTSTIESADAECTPSTGQADERWDKPLCPGWHNTVRFYRDTNGYSAVTIVETTACAACEGTGSIPYARDVKKPVWARRMRACPNHVPTTTRNIDPDRVPKLA